jgi:hypothetical protein
MTGQYFTFIHIPKTGGSAIKKVFQQDFQNWLKLNKWINNYENGDTNSIKAAHRKYKDFSIFDIQGKPIFGIVRNPWDWHVSFYEYFINNKSENVNEVIRKHGFMQENYISFEKHIKNINTYMRYGNLVDLCLDELYTWLSDFNGKIKADWIKFENLEDNLNEYLEKINVQKVKLEKIRITKKRYKDYRKYYNEETYNIIKEKHKNDIKLFNYKF